MATTYLRTCREVSSIIDINDLAKRIPGEQVGTAGSGYCFRRLGQLASADSSLKYVGLKIPGSNTIGLENRLRRDLAFIGLQLRITPELDCYFPNFMNLVQVDDSQTMAILMEDVSEGGQRQVCSAPASEYVREMLYRPFADLGHKDEVLDHHQLNRTTSFDVGGKEKLLDLRPLPIELKYLRASPLWRECVEAAYEALPGLTVVIPGDSVLGDALLNPDLENY